MIDASVLKYMYSNTYSNMYISWLVCFMTGSSYILQQPWTTGLAKTKANIVKKIYHSYSSRCLLFKTNTIWLPISTMNQGNWRISLGCLHLDDILFDDIQPILWRGCIEMVPNCTEVQFASLFSIESITAIVVNPPERRLAKCTFVHWCISNSPF